MASYDYTCSFFLSLRQALHDTLSLTAGSIISNMGRSLSLSSWTLTLSWPTEDLDGEKVFPALSTLWKPIGDDIKVIM